MMEETAENLSPDPRHQIVDTAGLINPVHGNVVWLIGEEAAEKFNEGRNLIDLTRFLSMEK